MKQLDQRTTGRRLTERLRAVVPLRPLTKGEAQDVAELQANTLLLDAEVTAPPVPESIITALPELTVSRRRALPRPGLTTNTTGDRWAVAVSADDPLPRQRYTLAHELKHVLDDPFITWMYPGNRWYSREDRAEWICNVFAACLLMPAAWVRRDWEDGKRDVQLLAERYRVSYTAMGVRLAELGLLPRRFGSWQGGGR